jgi:endonuclease YncB( thermonuclease family)
MKRAAPSLLLLQLAASVLSPALSADLLPLPDPQAGNPNGSAGAGRATTIAGRVAVLDGHTLWFPQHAVKVRLADIDSCELPQWSYDPKQHGERPIPKPVPCGPLAKAWLKRTVGAERIVCGIALQAEPGLLIGTCTAGGRDLALEMLRVGWARVDDPYPSRPEYLASQRHAMSARYGMWATYVLDMDEWRRKAIDRTLSRQSIADFNLLAERENEISPTFDDARRRPRQTDR